MKTRTLLLAGLLVGFGSAAYAHHSFSADYFEDQSITVDGDIEEFQYKNPHAWVFLRVQDEQGRWTRYGAEWAGAGRLRQIGIQPDTLRPGDHVRIDGAPGRDPNTKRIHLKAMERPADGWTWAGRGRFGRR